MTTYQLFTTPTCPNCPAVKEFMKTISLTGTTVDAATPEGREQAMVLEIYAVPTVVFFDDTGKEIGREHSVQGVKKFLATQ